MTLSPPALLGVFLLLLGVLLAELGRVRWATRQERRRRQQRARIARRGEDDAVPLVRSLGYDVVAIQPNYRWRWQVDGDEIEVVLRPDLLLARRGRTFIADVKTGRWAPDPASSATRRQLLEYLLACDVDGVLLVDMEARVVRTLAFPVIKRSPPRTTTWWAWSAGGMVLGSILTAWWLRC